jgi:hypothetical protein
VTYNCHNHWPLSKRGYLEPIPEYEFRAVVRATGPEGRAWLKTFPAAQLESTENKYLFFTHLNRYISSLRDAGFMVTDCAVTQGEEAFRMALAQR